MQINVKVELPERFIQAVERLAENMAALNRVSQPQSRNGSSGLHASGIPYEDYVLNCLRESSAPLSRADLAAEVSDREWTHTINRLLEDGRVIRTGEKKGTRYHLAPLDPDSDDEESCEDSSDHENDDLDEVHDAADEVE